MKALGTLLLLGCGLWVRRSVLRRHQEQIQAGEELLAALQMLERGIYTLRRPLGELLEQCRTASRLTVPFWSTAEQMLSSEMPFQSAWIAGIARLPEPYGGLLAPLGQILPEGEDPELLQQVREDVYRAVGQARRERGERDRLVTALCLSASLLLAVVLI